MIYSKSEMTHLGWIEIKANENSIISLSFKKGYDTLSSQLLDKAFSELNEYFARKRETFDLPLSYPQKVTTFQKSVIEEIKKIPYGETISYKEIAEKLNSKAYRAIGTACGKNQIPIFIPCHRVVGKNNIGGFRDGLAIKRKLLELEH